MGYFCLFWALWNHISSFAIWANLAIWAILGMFVLLGHFGLFVTILGNFSLLGHLLCTHLGPIKSSVKLFWTTFGDIFYNLGPLSFAAAAGLRLGWALFGLNGNFWAFYDSFQQVLAVFLPFWVSLLSLFCWLIGEPKEKSKLKTFECCCSCKKMGGADSAEFLLWRELKFAKFLV